MSRRGSRRTCEICGIKEAHSEKRLFLASFPIDENRCREWVRISGNEDLAYLPIEKLHRIKHSICDDHFKKNDFSRSRNKLKKHIVPSTNITRVPLSDDLFIIHHRTKL